MCELSENRNGFAHEINVNCPKCDWKTTLKTSKTGSVNKHKEVNVRMVAFIRSLGKGHRALRNFSTYLNSPSPMTHRNYKNVFNKIHTASKEIAKESMCKAAQTEIKTAKQETSDLNLDLDLDIEPTDCAVSVIGTWQRRGHASHHGVVTAISVQTGKCLDVEVLFNICKGCKHWEGKKGTVEYEKWKLSHACRINHTGSAGAMEAVGAVRIFSRSEEQREFRYMQYLGDGDSASFRKVNESKPYGESADVEKMECVGHVQKRCGTRLRKLVNEKKRFEIGRWKEFGRLGQIKQ